MISCVHAWMGGEDLSVKSTFCATFLWWKIYNVWCECADQDKCELCECKVNQFCFAEQGKVTFVADVLICIFTLNTFVWRVCFVERTIYTCRIKKTFFTWKFKDFLFKFLCGGCQVTSGNCQQHSFVCLSTNNWKKIRM